MFEPKKLHLNVKLHIGFLWSNITRLCKILRGWLDNWIVPFKLKHAYPCKFSQTIFYSKSKI